MIDWANNFEELNEEINEIMYYSINLLNQNL